MKIYTKTGDEGQTGLYGGGRVSKDNLRIEAFGAVDELNAALGVARAEGLDAELDHLAESVQNDLFALGAQLATVDPAAHGTRMISAGHILRLEQAIDRFDAGLPPLTQFILPGGTRAAAQLHLARTICRRAERRLVAMTHSGGDPIDSATIVYLNRLGDLLFVVARAVNQRAGRGDVFWKKPNSQG